MSAHAHPEVLVATNWVAEHANDPNVVIAEVNVDTELYDKGHVPGAVGWSWKTQLCDTVQRDILSKEEMEKLLSESGVNARNIAARSSPPQSLAPESPDTP